jgi:hypothetical protein
MEPSLAVEGGSTRVVFKAYYVEKALAPSLRCSGQEVVVMDNLFSAHKGERVRDLIEERGSASLSTCLLTPHRS